MPDRETEILLISRLYPSNETIYKYGFVHRRVIEYKKYGVLIDVVRPKLKENSKMHIFDGINCLTLSKFDLTNLLRTGRHRTIAIHGLTEEIWEVIAPDLAGRPAVVWLHGMELLDFSHVAYAYSDAEREAERAEFNRRLVFWRDLMAARDIDVRLVFVSRFAAERAMRDLGVRLEQRLWTVIPNPIDTQLFSFRNKPAKWSRKVLSIRPFKTPTYGSDLIIDTILTLHRRPIFGDLTFSVIGDGPLFDSLTAPLQAMPNVRVRRGFIPQAEIAEEHARHGLFLVPTRLDTQGVSRDEAMSSGLVPLTNAVDAVPEFVDGSCGIMAPANDSGALAEGIERLALDAGLFKEMSRAAARKVRQLASAERIIPQEIAYLRCDRR